MKISTIIRTLFARLYLFVLMCIYFIPMLIMLSLPRSWGVESKAYYWLEYSFCWLVMKALFVPITYQGLENIPVEPVVIVANHQSSLDIPLIISALRTYPHVWLALKSLMSSPILRFILPKIAVLVDVSTPITGMRTLIEAIKRVNGKKSSIIIFPEGGRYNDGKIHDFFSGFVILAKKMNRPVLPIMIKGAAKVYPRGSFWLGYEPITVTIGQPLYKEENEQDEIFHARVHRWFLEQNKE